MTDGKPQLDNSDELKSAYSDADFSQDYESGNPNANYPYYYKKNHPRLHDISAYLYDNDLRNDREGVQNVLTYTIGFFFGDNDTEVNLLQDTADRGQGKDNNSGDDDGGIFVSARSPEDLGNAFKDFFKDIEHKDTTFESAATPISDSNKAYTDNKVYLSMFKPKSKGRWDGNIKKYKLNNKNQLCSVDNNRITDSEGNIKDEAKDLWNISDDPDGSRVIQGGAGSVLLDRLNDDGADSRKIFTDKDLNSSEILTDLSSSDFTQDQFSLVTRADKEWPLGDFNHSAPGVADISGNRYIFAGTNDGLLHCFNSDSGKEEWAYFPWGYSSKTDQLKNESHSYFLDGSPCTAKGKNRNLIITGERRGGNNYYCLDISSISQPKYMYKHKTQAGSDTQNGGQSWKKPQFTYFKSGENSKSEAFLISGGYDTKYDETASVDDAKGYSVYALDSENDYVLSSINFDLSGLSYKNSKNSCVSAYAADTVDDGKDISNIIFAGDMEGNIYGFRDDNYLNPGEDFNGVWSQKRIFSVTGSDGKKIFAESDFVIEPVSFYNSEDSKWEKSNGEYIFFGTGDRANPLSKTETNYFYCIKNDWINTELTTDKTVDNYQSLVTDPRVPDDHDPEEDKLFTDVSDFLLHNNAYNQNTKDKIKRLNYLHNRGWYFKLEEAGEKCLSSPVAYNGVVYFTTFVPNEESDEDSEDPCSASSAGGSSRLYAVRYKTGEPAFNLNFQNDTETDEKEIIKDNSDRYIQIESNTLTLPPSPEIVITENGPGLLVGPVNPGEDLGEDDENKIVIDEKEDISIFYWKIK